jgi:hypothetical protein
MADETVLLESIELSLAVQEAVGLPTDIWNGTIQIQIYVIGRGSSSASGAITLQPIAGAGYGGGGGDTLVSLRGQGQGNVGRAGRGALYPSPSKSMVSLVRRDLLF